VAFFALPYNPAFCSSVRFPALRKFKSTGATRIDVSSKKKNLAKPLKAPTPDDGKFHLIKSEYTANSLSKAFKSGQITDDDKFQFVFSKNQKNVLLPRNIVFVSD